MACALNFLPIRRLNLVPISGLGVHPDIYISKSKLGDSLSEPLACSPFAFIYWEIKSLLCQVLV